MLKYLISIIILIIFSGCAHQFEGTEINVNLQNSNHSLLLLEDVATNEKVIVDSSMVQNGIARFKVYINDGIYRLREQQSNQMIFIYIGKQKEELNVNWNLSNQSSYSISGNKESGQLKSIVQFSQNNSKQYIEIDSIAAKDSLSGDQVTELKAAIRQKNLDFIKNFIDTVKNGDIAAFALNYIGSSPDNIALLVNLSEKIHQSYPDARYATMWFESLDSYRNQLLNQVKNGLSIGSAAPNFEGVTIEGDSIALKDFIGEYVLLDFWASWCQPCRKENPNLLAAYKEFKNRKFKIVSFSLDAKKEQWQKGIDIDKLKGFVHVSDLLKWRSPIVKAYDIKGIPANFLIDPNGKIIGRDLQGNLLQSTLNHILPPEMIEIIDSLGNSKWIPKHPVQDSTTKQILPNGNKNINVQVNKSEVKKVDTPIPSVKQNTTIAIQTEKAKANSSPSNTTNKTNTQKVIQTPIQQKAIQPSNPLPEKNKTKSQKETVKPEPLPNHIEKPFGGQF
ncbi:MAG: TlpA family protein disulfide reductase [Chitinophagales bacterium]|nr:TlpA family protein disulfide reductase [Chitinophagales bacterium]